MRTGQLTPAHTYTCMPLIASEATMSTSSKKMKEKRRLVWKVLEILSVVAIIAVIWIAMFLPVAIYFAPPSSELLAQNTTGNETPASTMEYSSGLGEQLNTTPTDMMSCQYLLDGATDLVCREDFFHDPADGGQCRPKCSSWSMFSKTAQLTSTTIIGMATVIGILTTGIVIVLSCVRFRRMLEFPSVLILYQDIIMSVHGVSVLIGLTKRRLLCTSEDLLESYESPSAYCTISGIISSYVVYPLTLWICIQVGYTFLGVRTPFYFKQLNKKKKTGHCLHLFSLLIGFLAMSIPIITTLALGGYSAMDTTFPPVVCWAKDRHHTVYTLLIPMGVMLSIIDTLLVLILHFLIRNRCISRTSSRELKQAEVKVLVICCWYVILGLATLLGYTLSSVVLDDLQHQLRDYFECERCGVNSGATCERDGFERFTNPSLITIAYSLLNLYPLITLVYVVRFEGQPRTKQSQIQQDITISSA